MDTYTGVPVSSTKSIGLRPSDFASNCIKALCLWIRPKPEPTSRFSIYETQKNPLHKQQIHRIFAELPHEVIKHILSYGTSIKIREGKYVNQIHDLPRYHVLLNRIPWIYFAREHWWYDPLLPLQDDLMYVKVHFHNGCRLYKYYESNNRTNEFVYFYWPNDSQKKFLHSFCMRDLPGFVPNDTLGLTT